MKRTESKKRFGKGFLPSHEFPNEQTKESFLIEIGELTKRLERFHAVPIFLLAQCCICLLIGSSGTQLCSHFL